MWGGRQKRRSFGPFHTVDVLNSRKPKVWEKKNTTTCFRSRAVSGGEA